MWLKLINTSSAEGSCNTMSHIPLNQRSFVLWMIKCQRFSFIMASSKTYMFMIPPAPNTHTHKFMNASICLSSLHFRIEHYFRWNIHSCTSYCTVENIAIDEHISFQVETQRVNSLLNFKILLCALNSCSCRLWLELYR